MRTGWGEGGLLPLVLAHQIVVWVITGKQCPVPLGPTGLAFLGEMVWME